MFNLSLKYKRGDKWVTAEECGLATQAADIATASTVGLTLGVGIATVPAVFMTMAGISMGLHALGIHQDRKKLAEQDNTPVVDTSVTV